MEPTSSSKLRVRGMILTAGVAAITMVGTFYGAGLKSDQEAKERRKATAVLSSSSLPPLAPLPTTSVSAPPEDEFIAALQTRRRAIEQTKKNWEAKAAVLRERIEANSRRDVPAGSNNGNSADTAK
ncbi:hypothetical protein CMQ_5266 [Grosmannia clavigera kw1407]|uniref:Uncharacterized protein n=1 Tax=Grosmannia clavigera (strain kw1407 / UAMH 11150) TaxID=655863 RepID=F0XBN8_GROCL|nr:uncharacterized protein CMQ_5266 [Grosmannia clavigera kw1407]EFX05004.1 hypothetical protein CMQ_5266 [Grosmannia clavigera kw1407]